MRTLPPTVEASKTPSRPESGSASAHCEGGGEEVLVGHHPLVDLLQDVRVAARRVGGRVLDSRMGLPPVDAEPERDRDGVARLLGAQLAEVLVLADQLLQGRAGVDPVGPELFVERGPAGLGSAGGAGTGGMGGGGRESQQRDRGQDEDRPTHGAAPSYLLTYDNGFSGRKGPKALTERRRKLRETAGIVDERPARGKRE